MNKWNKLYVLCLVIFSWSDCELVSFISYIYCHPQTDCFVLSELFSVARHVGRLNPWSKLVQLYVRLSIRPLGQQAYHVGEGNYKVLCSSSSVRLFTFLYPIGYQSAQFFRRALHYASGVRKFLRQSAQLPWGIVYIVTDRLFRSIRTLQCG